jgi:hypothetical protein
MTEQKQYTLKELKAKLTEKLVSEQLSIDNVNHNSGQADYINDRFSFVFQSFQNSLNKIFK